MHTEGNMHKKMSLSESDNVHHLKEPGGMENNTTTGCLPADIQS